MHSSKYTLIFPISGDTFILYNALLGAIDIASEKVVRVLQSLSRGQGEGPTGSSTIIEALIRRGYVYRSPHEEEAVIADSYGRAEAVRAATPENFVLAITYACNLDCVYCFQSEEAKTAYSVIDHHMLQQAFAFMDGAHAERNTKGQPMLTIFGGEPLIDSPARHELIEDILAGAAERGYRVLVATNGVALDSFVEMLAVYGVDQVQVTVDGPPEVHDHRRPLRSQAGTFAQIAAGVDKALRHGLRINLRFVGDSNNIDSLLALSDYVINRGWTGYPNFVFQTGRLCCGVPLHYVDKVLPTDQILAKLFQLYQRDPKYEKLLPHRMMGLDNLLRSGRAYPPVFNGCPGGVIEFALDACGRVFPCSAGMGKEDYVIGRYSPKIEMYPEQQRLFGLRSIFGDPRCTDCPTGLFCGGGCPLEGERATGSLSGIHCPPIRESLQLGLSHYSHRLEAMAKQVRGTRGTGPQLDKEMIHKEVVAVYGAAARLGGAGLCCAPEKIYSMADLAGLPPTVLSLSCGCGDPVSAADLKLGEVVLDIGSGGGIDLFLAVRRVGSSGRVIGLDASPDMLKQAQKNVEEVGVDNVELRQGRAEAIPLPSESVDVVISNCVIAMMPDKDQVFAEIFRVLRPSGRVVVSDIVASPNSQQVFTYDVQNWVNCVAGVSEDEYLATLRAAGFVQVEVLSRSQVQFRSRSTPTSVRIRGYKPASSSACERKENA